MVWGVEVPYLSFWLKFNIATISQLGNCWFWVLQAPLWPRVVALVILLQATDWARNWDYDHDLFLGLHCCQNYFPEIVTNGISLPWNANPGMYASFCTPPWSCDLELSSWWQRWQLAPIPTQGSLRGLGCLGIGLGIPLALVPRISLHNVPHCILLTRSHSQCLLAYCSLPYANVS